ncbi:MAG: adenylate/guanylate cyclase domain-containing protein, partial [Desulfobacteraceae bacterium]|nr:adenylate/guanylate cyclase domain-containing protein [Desulfobacteraceae bacterium]
MIPPSDDKLLKILIDSAKKVSMGDYDQTDSLMELTKEDKYPPEIAELAEAFGMMIVRVESREFNLKNLLNELTQKKNELEKTLQSVQLLESIQTHMRKFVPKSVQDLISDNPENPDLNKREKDISVLFLDIAGYTKMSEHISQTKMNYLIETYFSKFLDIIVTHNGDINETAGDGLMILFQGNDPKTNAINAVLAANAIQKKAKTINESLKEQNAPIIVNIGINSGIASVGSTRFQGISGDRWTFTASGPVTN